MDILIHSEGFALDDRKKALIEEKVGRLEHYAPRALRARVTVRMNSAHHNDKQFSAKILVEIPGNDLAAEKKAGEPIEAVDLLVEKMERQMERRKTERISRRTKGLTDKALAMAML
jgi:putative sigma-54 modulation protein